MPSNGRGCIHQLLETEFGPAHAGDQPQIGHGAHAFLPLAALAALTTLTAAALASLLPGASCG